MASNTLAACRSRSSCVIRSTSRMLRMTSGSPPSTSSCSPLRANVSYSSSVMASKPSRPSLRAVMLQLMTLLMLSRMLTAGGNTTQRSTLKAWRKVGMGVCVMAATKVPPMTMTAAGALARPEIWPPSIALPPIMATRPMRMPIRLRISMVSAQLAQVFTKVLQIQYGVGQAGGFHRHRHAIHHTTLFILGPDGGAATLQHFAAFPTVVSHAGKNRCKNLAFHAACGGTESDINAGTELNLVVALHHRHCLTACIHQHLLAARRQQRPTGTDRIIVLGLFHADLAQPVQPLGKCGGERARHVLHQQNRERKTGRKFYQNILQCHRATGGSADQNQARTFAPA